MRPDKTSSRSEIIALCSSRLDSLRELEERINRKVAAISADLSDVLQRSSLKRWLATRAAVDSMAKATEDLLERLHKELPGGDLSFVIPDEVFSLDSFFAQLEALDLGDLGDGFSTGESSNAEDSGGGR